MFSIFYCTMKSNLNVCQMLGVLPIYYCRNRMMALAFNSSKAEEDAP